MTQEQFIYWLQGFMELSGEKLTNREQIIKDHLQTVFHKVTPDYRPIPLVHTPGHTPAMGPIPGTGIAGPPTTLPRDYIPQQIC